MSAGVVAALLYLFNPPITQLKRTDDLTSEKQAWWKVLAACFFVLLLVLLLPEFIRLANHMMNKRKSKKS